MALFSDLDSRNDPPGVEPIFFAAIILIVAVLAIVSLVVAAS